jgi:hypothetical protein
MKLSPLTLAATVALGLGSFAFAGTASAQSFIAPQQAVAPHAEMQFTPAHAEGTVARYIVGPAGHVRGFQLDTGAVVMTRGREGDALAQQLPAGQTVRVDGFTANGNTQMLRRATVHGADGAVLVAPRQALAQGAMEAAQAGHAGFQAHRSWTRRDPEMRARMIAELEQLPMRNASGTVSTVLTGPRGHVNGVLLSDGTSVFFTHMMSREIQHRGIRVGEAVRVAGRGGAYPHGASLLAEQMTFANGGAINAPIGAR